MCPGRREVPEGVGPAELVDPGVSVIEGDADLKGHIQVEASHVEIALIKQPSGELELGTIKATGNVIYRDGTNTLVASAVQYDHTTQWMEMWSETDQPCSAIIVISRPRLRKASSRKRWASVS